jgi:hypothetical protein
VVAVLAMMRYWKQPHCPTCDGPGEEVTTTDDTMRLFVCPDGHRFNTRGKIIPDDEGTDGSAGQTDQSG